MNETCDVVVVGGGAAGLSGAVTLGRSRRSVVVIDAGEPRNAPADGVHVFLTRDGIAPADLVRAGQEEARSYGAEIVEGRAVSASGDVEHGFVVELEDGREVRGRRLLVTTGLVDELPAVDGLRERWGRDVVHCAYCHGWEVRDRQLVVLATGRMGFHGAALFQQLSDDVTLVLDGADPLTAEEGEQLAARGVRVLEGHAEALEVSADALTGLRLAGGEVVPCTALVVASRMVARSAVLDGVGLTAQAHAMGADIGEHVPSGMRGETAVPGVYVAGNVTDLMAQVVAASAGGVMAGAGINADLVAEDLQAAVRAAREPVRS